VAAVPTSLEKRLAFRVLGPLEVTYGAVAVPIAGSRQRALLAYLLLHANRVVATDRLIDELFGDEAPDGALNSVHAGISRLRRQLTEEGVAEVPIVTRPPGYFLELAPEQLDLNDFERLLEQGRRQLDAGAPDLSGDTIREALALWRGSPLADIANYPFAQAEASRPEGLRVTAVTERIEADLASGRHPELVGELESLVAAHPLDERLRGLLMLALYRSGRQADALELFRRTRELFVEELGIEPGPELRELQQAMLRQDTDLRLTPVQRETAQPRPRRRVWLPAAVVLVLAVAGITAALLARDGSGKSAAPPPTTAAPSRQLRSFVYTLENFLQQSHEGRAEATRVLAGAFDCSLPPQVAAAQLDSVQENRQSLLEQLAALHVPDSDEALHVSDLFQKASHASIAADWIYRDWLRTKTSCVRDSRPPAAARRADARATALKARFLASFNPLAERFGRRVWRADQF